VHTETGLVNVFVKDDGGIVKIFTCMIFYSSAKIHIGKNIHFSKKKQTSNMYNAIAFSFGL
jgi:hypothetical protein